MLSVWVSLITCDGVVLQSYPWVILHSQTFPIHVAERHVSVWIPLRGCPPPASQGLLHVLRNTPPNLVHRPQAVEGQMVALRRAALVPRHRLFRVLLVPAGAVVVQCPKTELSIGVPCQSSTIKPRRTTCCTRFVAVAKPKNQAVSVARVHRNTVLEMVLVEEDITLSEMHALSRVCACSRLHVEPSRELPRVQPDHCRHVGECVEVVGQRQALARPVAPDEGVAHDDVLAGVPLAHVGKQTTLHQGGQERRQPGMLRLPVLDHRCMICGTTVHRVRLWAELNCFGFDLLENLRNLICMQQPL
mmetsp:Transcript_21605/g.41217  ORF Transcript_21605/g.41217 Transcript_21605/m.41217 type:complete len:303 (-) Transcript_21605:168-1076(-)